jgi:hypothetical protein
MGRGGELAHVRADLGQDDLGGALVDPGMVSSSATCSAKGAITCSIRPDSTAMVSSRSSMWARIWATSSP